MGRTGHACAVSQVFALPGSNRSLSGQRQASVAFWPVLEQTNPDVVAVNGWNISIAHCRELLYEPPDTHGRHVRELSPG